MKKIVYKPYCDKVKTFGSSFGIEINDQDFFKKRTIIKKIKSKVFDKAEPKNFNYFANVMIYVGLEVEMLKEFFPLSLEKIKNDYEEFLPRQSVYDFKSNEDKIRFAYVPKDRIFKKRLTLNEYKSHVNSLYRIFSERFNKDFLQFGGYFLSEDGSYITDKNKNKNGEYRRIPLTGAWLAER